MIPLSIFPISMIPLSIFPTGERGPEIVLPSGIPFEPLVRCAYCGCRREREERKCPECGAREVDRSPVRAPTEPVAWRLE